MAAFPSFNDGFLALYVDFFVVVADVPYFQRVFAPVSQFYTHASLLIRFQAPEVHNPVA